MTGQSDRASKLLTSSIQMIQTVFTTDVCNQAVAAAIVRTAEK